MTGVISGSLRFAFGALQLTKQDFALVTLQIYKYN
jgi:hypothetical protein